ncbi:putative PEP-CTERM system TPR-repeat lipoprotein [Paucibacter oligotrophus]|uniref:Putative PEP-CTERM system TPR-repeat lipoprotein n=1 Tax=Roseateles oligotrophus TaxID=1769250 RepID=A0A840L4R2_9BURK|nr:XrtA/PEP-CTERM system TPR-repeat protein PrsT [Roseateles oligotrophus]MBB4841813.1 putative PEP-CTERM system TPR-repeat lipoprotein [Roseateles oligotrophus]
MTASTSPTLARPPFPAHKRAHALRPLALAALLCLGPSLAQASPEKAAKFYEDAQQRFEKGDLSGASIQLKNTIQEDNKMLAAHLLLGKVLFKNGELKGAEAAFEEAIRQGVSRSELAIPMAQLYLQLGERKKLLDQINTTGLGPAQQAEVLTLRGTAYALSGNNTLAAKSFADAKAIDPRSAAPLMAEAQMLLRAGERDKARATAQRATELAPDNGLTWYTLATILQATQDLKGALAAQEKALAINPKQVDARVSRAALLLSLGRQKDAEDDLALLAAAKQADPRASYMRAILAAKRGDEAAAKKSYAETVTMIDPMPPGLLIVNEPLLMAGALSNNALGNREKARGYLETLIGQNPRHYAAQVLMASILLETRDYGKAQPMLENLQRANPEDTQVMYLLGSVHLARKRYQQATEMFERAAQRAGANAGDALRELGFSQLGMGQDKLGQGNLEKAFAANPGDARAGVQLAMIYARQGQSARALQTAQAIVKLDPNNLTMLNFLGNIKGRSGDKAGAREAFTQVLAKDPAFRPAGINLSWLDIEEKRFEEARARLKQMLGRVKDDPDVLFELGILELRAGRNAEAMLNWQRADEVQRADPRPGLSIIDLLSSQKQFDKALEAAKLLAGKHPGKLPVQLALGRAYLAVGDATNARLSFQDATKLAEFDAEKQILIGRMQLQAGNPDGAAYNVQKALQARPDDQAALVLQVEVEARRGDNAKLDAALKTLSSKYPGSLPTLMTVANVAMLRGQLPLAQSNYRAAMDKSPNTGTAILLVRAQIAAGETDKALAFLEDWARKQPDDRLLLKALAEVQLQAGKNEAARKSYTKLMSLEPEDPSILSGYASLLLRIGDPAAAAMAEKALKLAPGNPDLTDLLGWILVKSGNLDAGLRHLREARLRSPGNGEIRFHLAYALAKSGRKAEAKEELNAALNASNRVQASPELAQLKSELGV